MDYCLLLPESEAFWRGVRTIVREGKDKGQGVGYLPDGTMVVVNNGHTAIGQHVEVQVQSLLQTGAGVIVFAELKQALPTPATPSDTAMIGR